MFDALPASDTRDDVGNLLDALRDSKHCNRFSDCLFRGVTEDTLGSAVPAENDSVQTLADDRVLGGINNSGEQGFALDRAVRGNVLSADKEEIRTLIHSRIDPDVHD